MDIASFLDILHLIVIFVVGIALYGIAAILLMTIGMVFFYVILSFIWDRRF